jgi:hypothetical protein
LSKAADKATQLEEITIDRGFIAVDVSNVIDRRRFVDALADVRAGRTRAEMENVMRDQLQAVADQIDLATFWKRVRRQQISGVLLHADAVTAFDGRLAQLGRAHIILRKGDHLVAETAARLMAGVGT